MNRYASLTLSLFALFAAACSSPSQESTPAPSTPPPAEAGGEQEVSRQMTLGFVEAVLQPLGGSGVDGKVTFSDVPGGVRVEAHVNGLTPGNHGFHIHEVGDCGSDDGSSAGGHFNPMGVPHAGPEAETAHAGDLGNLRAGADGHGMVSLVSKRITLADGAATDILGRAVIVHADADDLASQPTGAAGGRVACGVIVSTE